MGSTTVTATAAVDPTAMGTARLHFVGLPDPTMHSSASMASCGRARAYTATLATLDTATLATLATTRCLNSRTACRTACPSTRCLGWRIWRRCHWCWLWSRHWPRFWCLQALTTPDPRCPDTASTMQPRRIFPVVTRQVETTFRFETKLMRVKSHRNMILRTHQGPFVLLRCEVKVRLGRLSFGGKVSSFVIFDVHVVFQLRFGLAPEWRPSKTPNLLACFTSRLYDHCLALATRHLPSHVPASMGQPIWIQTISSSVWQLGLAREWNCILASTASRAVIRLSLGLFHVEGRIPDIVSLHSFPRGRGSQICTMSKPDVAFTRF